MTSSNYKPTILVADDSDTFLMYISIFLSRMHYEVVPVRSGNELLKTAKVMRPDIFIIDVIMPDMDGVETLRQVKADEQLSEIPVIMISADSDRDTVEACHRLGCSSYLSKPLNIKEMNDALQALNIYHSGKRKYLRATYDKNVYLTHKGETHLYRAETLSERGVYIRKKDPLSVGSEVGMVLPLNDESVSLNGVVIYSKGLEGERFTISPGMAVQFNNLTDQDAGKLSCFITNILIGDLLKEQEEAVLRAMDNNKSVN